MIRYFLFIKDRYLDERAQSMAEYAVLLTFVFITQTSQLLTR